jgi:predicted metal-binding membrane protein
MSIFWMAVVAGLITIEKVVPWRRVAVLSTMALLLALAVGVLVAPGSVPGFVIPGGGMPGMSGM